MTAAIHPPIAAARSSLVAVAALLSVSCWHGARDPRDDEEDAPQSECLYGQCKGVDTDTPGTDSGNANPEELLGDWQGSCELTAYAITLNLFATVNDVTDGAITGDMRLTFDSYGYTYACTGRVVGRYTDPDISLRFVCDSGSIMINITAGGAMLGDDAMEGRCTYYGAGGPFSLVRVGS